MRFLYPSPHPGRYVEQSMRQLSKESRSRALLRSAGLRWSVASGRHREVRVGRDIRFSGVSASAVACSLQFEHFCIARAQAINCVCVPCFRDTSVFEHDDAVRHAHGGKTVRDQKRHLAFGEFGEALETPRIRLRASSAAVGSSRIEKLRIAQIGAGEGDLLPFAAGKVDAAFESAAEHLLVPSARRRITASARLFCGGARISLFGCVFDAADGDVFPSASFRSA